jgi:FtsZ-binding cell division protein ZapB
MSTCVIENLEHGYHNVQDENKQLLRECERLKEDNQRLVKENSSSREEYQRLQEECKQLKEPKSENESKLSGVTQT